MAEGMSAPLIGISAYCEQARWGVWETQAMVLPRRYADRVSAAGGIPVLLPPVPDVEEALGQLDGLMLSGGGDIDPPRYAAQPAPQTSSVREERDTAEFALFAAALARRLPVLGICRGLQIINVARGGRLHQHLPAVVGHDGHAPVPGGFGTHPVRVTPGSRLAGILGRARPARPRPAGVGHDGHAPVPGAFGTHPVRVTPGSRLAGILGRDEADVPTHHHQAVDRLGDGLTATAWASDGTLEAFELDPGESPVVLGVQWHPEAGDDPSLFRALVAAARGRAPPPAPACRPGPGAYAGGVSSRRRRGSPGGSMGSTRPARRGTTSRPATSAC